MSRRDLFILKALKPDVLLKELILDDVILRRRNIDAIEMDTPFIIVGGCAVNDYLSALFFCYTDFHTLIEMVHVGSLHL